MNADTGDSDMISQRRLPAGLRAPRHGSVPHPYGQTLRTKLPGQLWPPHLEGAQPRLQQSRVHIEVGRCGRQTFSPNKRPVPQEPRSPKLPLRRVNLTCAAASGQFTLSYRLLPFSSRTLVGSLPQNRTTQNTRGLLTNKSAPALFSATGRSDEISSETLALPEAYKPGVGGQAAIEIASLRTSVGPNLVRLPPQEGWNVQLILFTRVMHRGLPAVLVEALVCRLMRSLGRRPLGIFRYRRFMTRLVTRFLA
jgi:hypothetical protein